MWVLNFYIWHEFWPFIIVTKNICCRQTSFFYKIFTVRIFLWNKLCQYTIPTYLLNSKLNSKLTTFLVFYSFHPTRQTPHLIFGSEQMHKYVMFGTFTFKNYFLCIPIHGFPCLVGTYFRNQIYVSMNVYFHRWAKSNGVASNTLKAKSLK